MSTTTLTTTEIRAILLRQEHPLWARLYRLDVRLTHGLARYSLALLRVSAGIVFLWLGALKLSPGLSADEPLIHAALPGVPMAAVAFLEIAIGLSFLISPFKRALLPLLLVHGAGALVLVVLRADLAFRAFPLVLTVEGERLTMHLIILMAGLVIAATARGGGLVAESEALGKARQLDRKAE